MMFRVDQVQDKVINKRMTRMGIHNSVKLWALGLALSISPFAVGVAFASDDPTPPVLESADEAESEQADLAVGSDQIAQAEPVKTVPATEPAPNPMNTNIIDKAALRRQPEMPGALNTLEEALKSAYRNNTEIRELQAQLRARDEGVPQALAGWRPTVNLTASIAGQKDIDSGSYKDGEGGAAVPTSGKTSSTAQAALQLRQNLFNGGKTIAGTRQAENLVQTARAQLTDKEREIFLAVVQAYLDVIEKHAELELRKSNEQTLLKTLEATRDKFNVGEETRTSIAQADAELADGIAKRQTTEAQLMAAVATFERVTGARPGTLKKPGRPSNLPHSLKEAIDIAQKNNPAIRTALFQEKADRDNIKVNDADLLPKVDLQAASTRTGTLTRNKFPPNTDFIGGTNVRPNDHDFQTVHNVSVQLTVPIYEAGAIRGKGRELRETAEQRRIQIETTRRRIIAELSAAWETYLSAKASVTNYQSQVKANEVALEGTRQELLVGSKILLDVLNAQRTLVQSQLNLVQEEQRYYQAAYTVLALMGRLTALDMNLQVKRYDPQVHYQDVKYSW